VYSSEVKHQRVEGLVQHGLLYARTTTMEWILPGDEETLSLPDGYVVSFMHFLKRGLTTPTHRFL
jgi:hypothetical protein